MTIEEQLLLLNEFVEKVETAFPPSEDVRFEQQVMSVWGNLAIERPDVTVAEVRSVLAGR